MNDVDGQSVSVSPVTITELVAGFAVGDGQAVRPVLGESRSYFLTFHEVRTIFVGSGLYGDARWVEAQASGPPGGDDPYRTRWPTSLRGVGWAAMWVADRPVHGAVRLYGYLQVAIAFDSPVPVVGVVRAIRGNWADLELTGEIT